MGERDVEVVLGPPHTRPGIKDVAPTVVDEERMRLRPFMGHAEDIRGEGTMECITGKVFLTMDEITDVIGGTPERIEEYRREEEELWESGEKPRPLDEAVAD